MSPFEIVYGFNPQAPIDLLPLPSSEQSNLNFRDRADKIKDLHMKVKENLEKATEKYASFKNRGKKQVTFQPGDWVWLYLRQERFPSQRRSKLLPRGDGPFQVIEKVGDNAYKLDLPGEYKVHFTFNVCDLSPFDVGDERSIEQPFQEDGDGVNTMAQQDPIKFPVGPITRLRAKRYQVHLNAFCQEWFNSFNDFNDSTLNLRGRDLCVLRCIGSKDPSKEALEEEEEEVKLQEEEKEEPRGSRPKRAQTAPAYLAASAVSFAVHGTAISTADNTGARLQPFAAPARPFANRGPTANTTEGP